MRTQSALTRSPKLAETSPPTLVEFPRWLFSGQRGVWIVVSFLLAADICFIGLHCWAELRGLSDRMLRIDVDRGYAESFQGVKYLYLLVVTTITTLTYRSWHVALWLPMFVYLLVDDLMMVHEIVGSELVEKFGLQPLHGLRDQDIGELLVTLTAVAALGVPLLLGYLLGHRTSRWFYRVLVILTIALGGFGVVVDLVHVQFASTEGQFDWIAVLEDGGEMIVVTCMALFLTRVAVGGGEPGMQTTTAPDEPGAKRAAPEQPEG